MRTAYSDQNVWEKIQKNIVSYFPVHVHQRGGALDATLPERIFSVVIEDRTNLFYGSPEATKSWYDCLSAGVTIKNVSKSRGRPQCMHRDDIELLYGCH